ncbi:RmlC-like cupin domain-containing protein [Parachaetomium inaequale]|uniref:Mannose-6-phosphate isomerase n=1 Tax=Parachaetomium inaequale TaxID=2588326 RepID=A0AAN6PBT4_9PEZI|nr:RmlC-like cupin domain-containing protein [Parachaetomium inaequale]
MTDRVFQLSGSCNSYPWGKQGQDSLAAQLCKKTVEDFQIKDNECYSEMWFGDYPDFPARVLKTGDLLKDVLDKNKETLLGRKVIDQLDGQLPFLPKILSIAKALPLQIHPNKDLATKLHAKDPDNFTDPNHKPEIAVALSKFEVFAGFKPLDEIEALFKLPALRPFVPANTTQWTDQTLREVTRNLLKADDITVKHVEDLLSSTSKSDLGNAAYILDLLPRLQKQYTPEDPGSLVALTCMNFMTLQPGDALYIPADGIHAYLSGDIVECMARSNNVLNSGFCPPAERNNIDLFADTLTFKAHSKGDMMLPSAETVKSKTGKTRVYRPPMSEFDMLRAELGAGEEDEIRENEASGVLNPLLHAFDLPFFAPEKLIQPRPDGQGGGDEDEGIMSELEDVMLTNSFAVMVGGKEYMGLFGDLAKTLAMTIWSARDIEPGEEITISYSAAGLTSKERQESLEQIWGFDCRCSLCTAPPETLKVSNAHREEIRVLQGQVVELAQKGAFHEAVEAAERLFNLVEQEGLTEQMGGMYEVPARLYYHIGDLDKALEYTLKARHEIDGYGVPDKTGEESIKVLNGVIEHLEQEIKEKKEREADSERNDQGEEP